MGDATRNTQHTTHKPRVLVGMSGGVDSSLAAALLVEQGYDVTGGFIKNWSDTKDLWTGECQWRGERRDAMRVAARLGISLLTFDFEKAYRERVLERMFAEYKECLTPNPDVLCNEEIKFGLFLEEARKRGFDFIATGHYARIERANEGAPEGTRRTEPHGREILSDRRVRLLKGVDPEKDQSYFLHRVSQAALQQALFPIGGLRKTEVRKMAEERALPTAQKPDSQGICFIGKLDMHDFLRIKIPSQPGDIVTPEGDVVGTHDGLDAYTIGQRHGLLVSKDQRPWYVAAKHPEKNQLVVVPDREHPMLYRTEAKLTNVQWINEPKDAEVEVAVRYRQEPVSAVIAKDGDRAWTLAFVRPVWAIAPGQSAVVYRGEECLGGGFLA